MRRELNYSMQGTKVVQTMSRFDDEGNLITDEIVRFFSHTG